MWLFATMLAIMHQKLNSTIKKEVKVKFPKFETWVMYLYYGITVDIKWQLDLLY